MKTTQNSFRDKILWAVLFGVGLWGAAATGAATGHPLLGGPYGKVRNAAGTSLEGILVQLISHSNAVRTTVYSNEEGKFEFPPLPSGAYTLRIARPLEFRPYGRDSVRIGGATELEEIVLEPTTDSEFLPPIPEIAAQLTGSEWLMNLPGTWEEKKRFSNTCGGGCHAYSQIFRNRFDEHGWRLVVDRMLRYTSAFVINPNPGRRLRMVKSEEEAAQIVKWLARVRGPESKDPPFKISPAPRGTATRAIVTEYALPRLRLYPHDVAGDSKGNVWYTSHRSPFIGKLDPRTGSVKEYRVPSTPGAHPGTHWIAIDKNDVVWLSDNWAHKIIKFDPRTEQFTPVQLPHHGTPLNTPGAGNMALAADGSVWEARNGAVVQFNPETGEYLQQYPLKRIRSTYDNILSKDGRFWFGGASGTNLVGLLDIQNGQLWELETRSPSSDPARGGSDPEGNAWLGGRGGMLIKVESKTHQVREYFPPNPFVTFYEAMPDKNGEVWAGELQGGAFLRFNPRTDKWTEYRMPEPEVHDRRTWIDNSTNPVAVWYVDHNGWMVCLQPME